MRTKWALSKCMQEKQNKNNRNPRLYVRMKTKRVVFLISAMAAGNRMGLRDTG